MKSTPKKYNLLVVAHPDDETLFFGGLLQALKAQPWTVVCVTDGNADGQGAMRRKQFEKACRTLKVKEALWWEFPDVYERRLDRETLEARLDTLNRPAQVFTHGMIGEYGHPHHQDVSAAVHSVFQPQRIPVWSVAYNCLPDKVVELSARQYRLKTDILTHVYGSETQRFLNILPSTWSEGFVRAGAKEVEALDAYFSRGRQPRMSELKLYAAVWPYLKVRGHKIPKRLF